MNRTETVLPDGTRVRTHTTLRTPHGLLVAARHLAVRRADTPGTTEGVVGGHERNAYWIRHPGVGILAPYRVQEFEVDVTPDDDGEGASAPIAA